MLRRSFGLAVLLLGCSVLAGCAGGPMPGESPDAAAARAYRSCLLANARKMDDGKTSPDIVARDVAHQCSAEGRASADATAAKDNRGKAFADNLYAKLNDGLGPATYAVYAVRGL